MTPDRRSHRDALRLAAGAGIALAALAAVRPALAQDAAPPEKLLRIASDEPLTVRFASAVRASRVGSSSFRIVRESDGEPVSGRYVAGSFLVNRLTGHALVVDPEGYAQAVQVANGLDAESAKAFVDRVLRRCEQTGRLRDLEPLRDAVRKVFELTGSSPSYLPHYDPELIDSSFPWPRTLPQQEDSAPEVLRALRKIQAGDDALWTRYATENDLSAFVELSADPTASRFHHTVDPLTGQPRAESDFRRQENRRYVFAGARGGRVFTFVPDVPETPQLADIAFTANDQFRVTFSAGLPNPVGGLLTASGFRASVLRRAAHLETTDPNHDQTFGNRYGLPLSEPKFLLSELARAALRVVDVTPPNGERLVDPTTDWESPDNRFTVPLPERRPFVARLRFNQPLDPRTVTSNTFNVTQKRASVGTANERLVFMNVPVTVRLNQSRLGDVEVEIQPNSALDPSAEYQISARNLVRTLDGRSDYTDYVTSFTTAPFASQTDVVFEDFKPAPSLWVEAGTTTPRPLVSADAAHDPDGIGLFVPFLGSDPTPVAAIESIWFDGVGSSPRYLMNFDDPATTVDDPKTSWRDDIEGTNVHAPAGSTVRLFGRTAPDDIANPGRPNPFLVGSWIEMDRAHPEFPGGRFFQMRIEFTLPPGATPATADLPYVERISVVALRP